MKSASSKNSIKIVGTILICVMVLLLIILVIQFANIINLKNKQKKLSTTCQQTQKQIEEYDELLDYINFNNGEYNQEFLESYAREVYGWGKDGRTYYEKN